jgi:hypothetical protein
MGIPESKATESHRGHQFVRDPDPPISNPGAHEWKNPEGREERGGGGGTDLVDRREHGVGADGALEQLVHAGGGRASAGDARPRSHSGPDPRRVRLRERAARGGGHVGGVVEREAEVVVVAAVAVVHVHGRVGKGEAFHAVHVHGGGPPPCRAGHGASRGSFGQGWGGLGLRRRMGDDDDAVAAGALLLPRENAGTATTPSTAGDPCLSVVTRVWGCSF